MILRHGAAGACLLVACVSSQPDLDRDHHRTMPASFSAYPDARPRCEADGPRPCVTRLGALAPNNVSIADGLARDQGAIASCASHGFIGMLENQLHVQRGVSVDLSERFQLYSNFMTSGNMGTDPAVIARFPEIAARYGLMPEADYPYEAILPNAERFHQDLAQGLGAASGPTVDDAIAPTEADARERHVVLTGAEYLGALPGEGARPIRLPLAARIAEGAVVPEVEAFDAEGHGRIVPCFAETSGDLEVTPRELLSLCFDHDPTSYFACAGYTAVTEQGEGEDDCAFMRRAVDAHAAAMRDTNLPVLESILTLLDLGQASLVGLPVPLDFANKAGAVWTARGNLDGGGHAVTVVGYVTAEEIADPAEQDRGMLASVFDDLASALQPAHPERIAAARALSDPAEIAAALASARTASMLGQAATAEGGLLLFRNSWGRSFQGRPIGADGYQTMTFHYFLRAAMITTSRSVGLFDAGSCAPPPGFARTDPFFARFVETESQALGWNAFATPLVTSVVTSGAPPETLQAITTAIAECRASSPTSE